MNAPLSDSSLGRVSITLFEISLNQKTKATLSSLVRDEIIEKSDLGDNQSSSYKLTDKGFKELVLTFPFFRYLNLPMRSIL